MSGGSEMLRSRFSPRAVVLALVSVGVAACSADTTRFNDNPFASHGNPELTASMPQAQTAQAPQPRSATSVAANSTTAGPGRSGASEVTGSVLHKPASSGNWSWDGGTAVTVAAGETIDTIARRGRGCGCDPRCRHPRRLPAHPAMGAFTWSPPATR